MPDEPVKDVVAEAERMQAAKAARERALAAPQRLRTGTNATAVDKYAQAALDRERRAVAEAIPGTREATVNTALLALGRHVAAGKLTEAVVRQEIESACFVNKFIQDDYGGSPQRFWKRKGDRSLRDGMSQARDYSRVGTAAEPEPNVVEIGEGKRIKARPAAKKRRVESDDDTEELERRIVLTQFSRIDSRAPQWVWEHEGFGCIQLGTFCLFAGRPAAGKSTAARWFASELSRGALQGVWHGHPMNVALFCAEEQNEVTVHTSLTAANAEMSKVWATEVKVGEGETMLRAIGDEHELTKALIDNGIRCLIVDPVMETFDSKTDINRNNEVRAFLQPYVRIAKAINGIVVGVVHLKKNGSRDVMADINGSSAFGEVARSIIGFAEAAPGEPLRIVEQVKNSAGPPALRWNYKLTVEEVDTNDGLTVNATRFELVGPSELSIADIGNVNDDEADQLTPDMEWLKRYLEIEQPAPSADVKRDALQQADISPSRLQRARKKLKVVIINDPRPETSTKKAAPHSTSWCLPDSYAAQGKTSK